MERNFEVLSSGGLLGRFMVATRDIVAEEIIFDKDPNVMICPKVMNACLECCRVTEDHCEACGFCMCDDCFRAERIWHSSEECLVLQRGRSEGFLLGPQDLLCLYVVRAWLSVSKEPSSPLLHLSSHAENIHPRLHVWNSLRRRLQDTYDLSLSPSQLARLLGLRRINAKSICENRGFGIFATFSLINHACSSNASPTLNEKDLSLTLRAKGFIRKGAEITVTYGGCGESLGQPRKRDTLFRHWDFICNCSSCVSPKAGLRSGVLCLHCCRGYAYPIPANIPGGKWICDTCEAVHEEEEIKILLEDEELLHVHHYLRTLHPNAK